MGGFGRCNLWSLPTGLFAAFTERISTSLFWAVWPLPVPPTSNPTKTANGLPISRRSVDRSWDHSPGGLRPSGLNLRGLT